MEKLELAKEYADMVKKHEKEALAMVSRIATAEVSEDCKEILYKVMDYSVTLSHKSRRAQYYYQEVVEEVIEEEKI
jgi:hypothetical protein